MYGDVSYQYLMGGSTATSAATPHDFYGGAYEGLSDLNANEVLIITAAASTGLARIGPSGTGDQIAGVVLSPSQLITLPPMIRTDASQMRLHRETASNPIVYWSLWVRRPL